MRIVAPNSRLGAMLAAGLVAATALSACGSDSADTAADGGPKLKPAAQLKEPTKPVTIKYVGAAYPAKALKPVIAAFEKAHPMIDVKYQEVPFDRLNNVLSTRLGNKSKDLDVFDVDMPRTAAYAARGWLTDVTPAFGKLEGKIDKASLDATTIDGKLLGMPLQTSSQLLYYNKKQLKKAGIPEPSADPADRLTWEQVGEDARKAKETGGAKSGILFDQIDRYYQLQVLPMSAGGSPGGTGAKNLEPDITGPEWTKAMSFYGKLFEDKVSPRGLTTAETSNVFAAGDVAYYVGGPWWSPVFVGEKDLDFGVAPHPFFEGGKPFTPTGAWSLGLNKFSTKSEAAQIFMRFMGLDGGGFSQYVTDIAVPPANVEGTQTYYAQKQFSDPRMAGSKEILEYELAKTAVVRLKTVGYIEFEDIMGKAFGDIVNGTPAPKALEKAKGDLTSAWQKYQ